MSVKWKYIERGRIGFDQSNESKGGVAEVSGFLSKILAKNKC